MTLTKDGQSAAHHNDHGYTAGPLRPLDAGVRYRAVRVLAANAVDRAELVDWLGAFGLDARDGMSPRQRQREARRARRKRARANQGGGPDGPRGGTESPVDQSDNATRSAHA